MENLRSKTILVVLVNYGVEQLSYLDRIIAEFRSFKNYKVKIVVNSNIYLANRNIDKLNVIELDDYQLLPMTCRRVIWENRKEFDIFIYGENDHLMLEKHIDKHLEYAEILPRNRISGLLQYEINETGRYFPGYHFDFEWDFKKVEIYDGKIFAHFSNLHQASFILTRNQLLKVGQRFNFNVQVNEKTLLSRLFRKVRGLMTLSLERQNKYSVKCKVNTDIYKYGGMKKLICITDFEDNLIHHLPNIYIDGLLGRKKYRAEDNQMKVAINRLLNFKNFDK